MTYKVFLSHSTKDRGLVIALANVLTKFGVEVSVAEWYLSPGEPLDRKVFAQIDTSDCVIVLLTRYGVRSPWVHQEVGYTLKTGKPLIPLVEKVTDSKNLAALQGKEYISYDPEKPEETLIKASFYVKSLKLEKEEGEKLLLIVGGIFALILLLFGGEK
jgi:nucleoside 2-deoxyribosyltransferase